MFSAASRGSAAAQLQKHFINHIAKYHRTPSGNSFEIIAKSIQKRRRIKGGAESMAAPKLDFGGLAASPGMAPFSVAKSPQNMKIAINNY